MWKSWGNPNPVTRKVFHMATTRKSRKSGTRQRKTRTVVQKPSGAFHPRVQKVGPEHFGIVCVDCAKVRSKFMVADFYGNILMPPTVLEHNRLSLDAAIALVRATFAERAILDSIVAIERTGRYHQTVQRAFANAAFEKELRPLFSPFSMAVFFLARLFSFVDSAVRQVLLKCHNALFRHACSKQLNMLQLLQPSKFPQAHISDICARQIQFL